MRACVFLADGFEEIEGLTVVDILRRAGVETRTVSITEQRLVTGSHQILVTADSCIKETDFSEVELLVLPGGMPGTRYLGESAADRAPVTVFQGRQKSGCHLCGTERAWRTWNSGRKESCLLSGI